MCMQDANFGLGLLSLGQNGGLLHSHQNLATICQGIKIKTFYLIVTFMNQPYSYFCWRFTRSTDRFEFWLRIECHFAGHCQWAPQTQFSTSFNFLNIISGNLSSFVGVSHNDLWYTINTSNPFITQTWRLVRPVAGAQFTKKKGRIPGDWEARHSSWSSGQQSAVEMEGILNKHAFTYSQPPGALVPWSVL